MTLRAWGGLIVSQLRRRRRWTSWYRAKPYRTPTSVNACDHVADSTVWSCTVSNIIVIVLGRAHSQNTTYVIEAVEGIAVPQVIG